MPRCLDPFNVMRMALACHRAGPLARPPSRWNWKTGVCTAKGICLHESQIEYELEVSPLIRRMERAWASH
jgi:hypothetical protein